MSRTTDAAIDQMNEIADLGQYEEGRYTEGICQDGAAILYDGVQLTISEVLARLNQFERSGTEIAALKDNQANESRDYQELRDMYDKLNAENDTLRTKLRELGEWADSMAEGRQLGGGYYSHGEHNFLTAEQLQYWEWKEAQDA